MLKILLAHFAYIENIFIFIPHYDSCNMSFYNSAGHIIKFINLNQLNI